MKYLLLIYNCDRPEATDGTFPEALASVNAFVDECRRRGAFLAGDPLTNDEVATTVAVRNGKTMITDGPFVETREHLGGYYVLNCRDLDEALELAALCPMASVGTIEVRPLVTLPGLNH